MTTCNNCHDVFSYSDEVQLFDCNGIITTDPEIATLTLCNDCAESNDISTFIL